ncbi:uncharacterized protein LOC130795965 [Actinidia eriantha]|uniref:uncharacterized protein LOC130795965 n=1 Tax=Actinidia eriantha TaxID=165200 RepID=UPI002587A1A0|nr:uncharacterized protein LOC130795965 [Actinidia eriantha]
MLQVPGPIPVQSQFVRTNCKKVDTIGLVGKDLDRERRRRKCRGPGEMSAYENIVGGKLKLKGKALDVKAGGLKKKKKHKKHFYQISQVSENELSVGGNAGKPTDLSEDDASDANQYAGGGNAAAYDDHLTPAERRYMEQKERIDVHRLAKTANKSHRDRIQDFNQYLANMSEHYDIPKVGPG